MGRNLKKNGFIAKLKKIKKLKECALDELCSYKVIK